MKYIAPRFQWIVALLLLAWSAPLIAEQPASKKAAPKKAAEPQFIRVKRDAREQPIALETATVRYVPSSGEAGVVVDLVGVVHVADRAYYQKLNKQLEKYDVVLYELVAEPGTRIPKGGKREKGSLLAMIHNLAKTVLDLDSQVEQIDYTKKNFVHADLSPNQMAEAMRKRGDDGMTVFLSVAADLLREQNRQMLKRQADGDDDEVDILSFLLDPQGPTKMKRAFAQQLADSASGDGLGKTLTTILVTDRNQAAMKVFQAEMAKGKKKIAIFYGAAHMPDFDKRLREDFGLKRNGAEWMTAWDLKKKSRGLEGLFKMLDQ